MTKKPSYWKVFAVLFLAILASLYLYKDSFSSYFFQDDWFTFSISRASNLKEFLQFFIPRTDIIYYRPLGMQVPFFIIRSFFGLNPTAFHMIAFFTHLFNILLLYYLIKLINKNDYVAVLTSFLYGTSAVHYIPFYWLSTFPFILGPTIFLISLIFYLKSIISHQNLFGYSVIFFILGIFVNELLITFPFILLLMCLYLYQDKKNLVHTLPFYIIDIGYIFARFIFFRPPSVGVYRMAINKEVLLNIKGYLIWLFNWPEEMKSQFQSLFKINPLFMKEFQFFGYSFILTLFIILSVFIIFILMNLFLKDKFTVIKKLIILFLMFIGSLAPVLFFSNHSFSYYLPIPLILILILFSDLLKIIRLLDTSKSKLIYLLIFLLISSWYYSSLVTVRFNSLIHWAPRRALLSEKLVKGFLADKKSEPNKKIFIIQNTSENKLALNNQDGLKIIFNDDNIETYYE